jgi:hypothetical protein
MVLPLAQARRRTAKPFKPRELHGTVTIRPEFKISNQKRPADVVRELKRRGVRSGLPDLLGIWRAKPIFVEMKSRAGVASKAQKRIWRNLSSPAPLRRAWRTIEQKRGFKSASIFRRTRAKVHQPAIVRNHMSIAWPINVRPGQTRFFNRVRAMSAKPSTAAE